MIREGTIQLPFTFAVGKAAGAVMDSIEERQVILGSRCASCTLTVAPARSFCPQCSSSELATIDVGPEGVLQAWSEVPGRAVFGLVLLDGADLPMAHRVLTPVADLSVGAKVAARFAASARDNGQAELVGFAAVEGIT